MKDGENTITVIIRAEIDEDSFTEAKQRVRDLYQKQGLVARVRQAIFGDSRQQRRMKNMVDTHAIIVEDMLDTQLRFTRRLSELENQKVSKTDEGV